MTETPNTASNLSVVSLRASRLPLLTRCSGSLYIPGAEEPNENRDIANVWGHMVHYWKETGEIRGPNKRTETALRTAIRESGIQRLSEWPSGGVHEQAVAVRVDGNRCIQSSHPTETTELLKWVTGTGDFYHFFLDGELWVDDLKTGKWYDDPETGGNRFPQDPRSTQVRLYALAIASLLGYRGRVHVSITHWPRLPIARRHSPPVRYWDCYEWDELEAFYGELEQLYRDAEAGRKGHFNLNPGDHCRFCPARMACFVAPSDEELFPWKFKYKRNT